MTFVTVSESIRKMPAAVTLKGGETQGRGNRMSGPNNNLIFPGKCYKSL